MHVKPLEKVDEERTAEQAGRHGWMVRKLQFVGVRGAPDRMFGKSGRTVVIEFKRVGEEPTRQQEIRHGELADYYGWEVHWTDNYADACRILGIPQ